MSLRQKLLIVSKSLGANITFDDVLAHTYFVTVVEDVIPFIIPKTVKKDKKQNQVVLAKQTNSNKSCY